MKSKKLWFAIIAYPSLLLLFVTIGKNVQAGTGSIKYGWIVIILSIVTILYILIEVISKVYNYEIQGSKLRFKLKEGIHVSDLEDNRNGNRKKH